MSARSADFPPSADQQLRNNGDGVGCCRKTLQSPPDCTNMFSRKNAYETTDKSKGQNLDEMSRKLAVDLRKHVRRLEMLPHHTKEWLGLTDSLQHIANVALMEHRLPREGDSTLWEGEELTVRYMLEEGKLNLCLRLMEEYKRGQAAEQAKGAAAYEDFLKGVAATCECQDVALLKARLLVFEHNLGVLLRSEP